MKNKRPTAAVTRRTIHFGLIFAALLAGSGGVSWAESADLLILHTNDVHDHVRPGYNGAGGLPYVSGYVQAVRETGVDLLVLDAGDVTEKGDMVAHVAGGELTYEAMRRVGYDAVAIGNHDNDAGLERLRSYEKALGQSLLCLNRVAEDGQSLFPGSRVLTLGEIRVGIIGLIVPQDSGTLGFEESGAALARESGELRSRVDLLIALCHESVEKCRQWSLAAPEIDLFVTGHSHRPLESPQQVPETGAWMVQAGPYARSVGRIELEVDLEGGGIVGIEGRLVEMRHEAIPADREMLDWIMALEDSHCPQAEDFVLDNSELLSPEELAWLGAEALRRAAGTEVGFCHQGQVIRDLLPLGVVDRNAIFLTGGFRAHHNLVFEMSGRLIEAYVEALAEPGGEPARWSGFTARHGLEATGRVSVVSDLEPDQLYSVIMPEVEWRTRFMRMARRYRERGLGGPLASVAIEPAEAGVTYTDAMTRYLRRISGNGWSLREVADQIRDGLGPGD